MTQLTYEDIARIKSAVTGERDMYTKPMDRMIDFAEKRTDLFRMDDEGCFVLHAAAEHRYSHLVEGES